MLDGLNKMFKDIMTAQHRYICEILVRQSSRFNIFPVQM